MKRRYINTVVALLVGLMVALQGSTSYAATTLVQTKSSCFAKEWELKIDYYIGKTRTHIGTLVYGFDKYAIDEDYAWGMSSCCKYQTSITNSNGSRAANVKSVGSGWSKIEVLHKGDVVTYQLWLQNTYSSVERSTRTSSIK